ncbi:hypothetical protein WN51_05892 [Melipona quadrifasciata]|uniref:Uncharacterized protein n=1 Tax=Melipona quadrifasciata TaxID=166423 RepID=A0A0N0BIN7_9HYME|nr:hypothetical protein WN51_05892 [Melipona quadrifasciata]
MTFRNRRATHEKRSKPGDNRADFYVCPGSVAVARDRIDSRLRVVHEQNEIRPGPQKNIRILDRKTKIPPERTNTAYTLIFSGHHLSQPYSSSHIELYFWTVKFRKVLQSEEIQEEAQCHFLQLEFTTIKFLTGNNKHAKD